MRVFGIDPGSTATGFAVVDRSAGKFRLLAAGVIRTKSGTPVPERLAAIHAGLAERLGEHTVDCVAIESIFRHRSSESALRLGQARGVALLAALRIIMHPTKGGPRSTATIHQFRQLLRFQ